MIMTKGRSAKDSAYLARIKKEIRGDLDHPRNRGVKMQAHHLISGEGMKISGLGKKVEVLGYNINLLPNLVFLPCTLQGACHLGIQPHRGNHDSLIDEEDYVDDMEPDTYHEMVARRIKELKLPLSKECPGDEKTKSEKIVVELDSLSRLILKLIEKKPNEASLTRIAMHFGKNRVGCSGVDSVTEHDRDKSCSVDRDHLYDAALPDKSQGKGQNTEKILYNHSRKHIWKVGR